VSREPDVGKSPLEQAPDYGSGCLDTKVKCSSVSGSEIKSRPNTFEFKHHNPRHPDPLQTNYRRIGDKFNLSRLSNARAHDHPF
jgi:hypothetical protein